MIYARATDESFIEARPDREGFCPLCDEPLIPVCGQVVIWHWRHKAERDCDPWGEAEGLWHLDWKRRAKVAGGEVEVTLKRGDVLHRADSVFTGVGDAPVVVEYQRSSIKASEVAEREAFYGEGMVWVVDFTEAPETKLRFSKGRPPWSMALKKGRAWLRTAKRRIFIDTGRSVIEVVWTDQAAGEFDGYPIEDFFGDVLEADGGFSTHEGVDEEGRRVIFTVKRAHKAEIEAAGFRLSRETSWPNSWLYDTEAGTIRPPIRIVKWVA